MVTKANKATNAMATKKYNPGLSGAGVGGGVGGAAVVVVVVVVVVLSMGTSLR